MLSELVAQPHCRKKQLNMFKLLDERHVPQPFYGTKFSVLGLVVA